MNILVIAAHYDDEVIGCGGTILKKIAAGDSAYVCIVTDSSSAQYPEDETIAREKEQACLLLHHEMGITKTYRGKFPDMRLDTIPHLQINYFLESVIRECQPDVIYTHQVNDVSLDHRRVFESTLIAARPTAECHYNIFTYEVPSLIESSPFFPTYYEDITEFLDAKLHCFEQYESEVRSYPHPRSVAGLRIHATQRGLEIRTIAAEAFGVCRLIQ
jgi:LmbE family N-acetylglucosaminyl deacetylase